MRMVYFVNSRRINSRVSSYEIPLAFVALSSAMREAGNISKTRLLDMHFESKERISEFDDLQTGAIYCFSCLTYNKEIVYELIHEVKQLDRSSKIIVGGPHATIMKRRLFEECSLVDFIIVGEGDISLPELVKAIESREAIIWSSIPGVISQSDSNYTQNNRISDLNCLPSIRDGFEFFDVQGVIKRNGYLPYICSRGCPFACIFCSSGSIWGNSVTRYSPERVITDLRFLRQQGVRYINFRDDLFTLDRKWLQPVLDELGDLDIVWGCETRADYINEDLLAKMKQSGCELIRYGIETFNQKTLDVLNKRIVEKQIKTALEATLNAGISEVRSSLIIGLPFEDKNDVEQTFETCSQYPKAFFKFFPLVPLRQTKLFSGAKKYGVSILTTSADISKSGIQTSALENSEINCLMHTAHELFGDPEAEIHRDFSLIFSKMDDPRRI